MKSKLIADAGSTNVEWCLVDSEGAVTQSFSTDGLNALLSPPSHIDSSFSKVAQMLADDFPVEEVHYYGAGCATPAVCAKLGESLSQVWPHAVCNVNSDLLGAARSLFIDRKGIACILGTGSNSCLYDGNEIVDQIPSLGYVLGDEGSGAALGKRLIADVFKKQLPDNIRDAFLDEYRLTLADILERIYTAPSPNRFLASFVPFLEKNLWNPYIYSLVLKELTNFMKRNVAMYKGAHSLDIRFTGSIAFHFGKILKEAAASVGYRVTEVTQAPMQGLVKFHTSQN